MEYDWKNNHRIDPLFDGEKPSKPGKRTTRSSGKTGNSSEKLSPSNEYTNKDEETGPNSVSSLINPPQSSAEEPDTAASPNEDDDDETSRKKALARAKRAAQNRNSQRAFRKRKELHLKELEAAATEVKELQKTIDELRRENHELRDYTMALQSEVLKLTHSMGSGNVPEQTT